MKLSKPAIGIFISRLKRLQNEIKSEIAFGNMGEGLVTFKRLFTLCDQAILAIELKAENERLREGLEKILYTLWVKESDAWHVVDQLHGFAIEALTTVVTEKEGEG